MEHIKYLLCGIVNIFDFSIIILDISSSVLFISKRPLGIPIKQKIPLLHLVINSPFLITPFIVAIKSSVSALLFY